MKALLATLILSGTSVASAQAPDPRDSIIIESKTMFPSSTPFSCQWFGLTRLRVWITNKYTVKAIMLPLETKTTSGTGYSTISRPSNCSSTRTFDAVFNFLLPAGQLPIRTTDFSGYNSSSPDSFWAALSADSANDSSKVPPNAARVPFLDTKFDSVIGYGQFEVDSAAIPLAPNLQFITAGGLPIKVNFVKGGIFTTTPDLRDSIIIESKYSTPQKGACASAILRVKVFITNKDSLANITLTLVTASTSGGAYASLSRRASNCARTLLSDVFDFLYPPGPGGKTRLPIRVGSYTGYNSVSRDSFLLTFTLDDPSNDDGKMPPNPTRTLLGEIKVDSVNPNLGQFEIDSSRILSNTVAFVGLAGNFVPVNFVKSVITVIPKGDLNLDGMLTAADMVLMLNGVFCAADSCIPLTGRYLCDMNCDGLPTAADVVLLLNAIFLGTPFPC